MVELEGPDGMVSDTKEIQVDRHQSSMEIDMNCSIQPEAFMPRVRMGEDRSMYFKVRDEDFLPSPPKALFDKPKFPTHSRRRLAGILN